MTLGATLVSGGHVLPYSEVMCDDVVKTVSFREANGGTSSRESALGRAMARVVAHELYHVLAGTKRHAAKGLAKASQRFSDLVGSPMAFRERDRNAMRLWKLGDGDRGVRQVRAGRRRDSTGKSAGNALASQRN